MHLNVSLNSLKSVLVVLVRESKLIRRMNVDLGSLKSVLVVLVRESKRVRHLNVGLGSLKSVQVVLVRGSLLLCDWLLVVERHVLVHRKLVGC